MTINPALAFLRGDISVDLSTGTISPNGKSVYWLIGESTHQELENSHVWVQWAFATPDPSRFNPHAPLLSKEESGSLNDQERQSLEALGDRFFWYLMWTSHWRYPSNHNHLRITRVLQSLQSAGLSIQANKIHYLAKSMGRATEETLGFWEKAMNVKGV